MLPVRTGQFRHVVFADALNGAARAINYSPAGPAENDRPLKDEESDFVRALFHRFDVDSEAYRPETLRRRLPACMRALQAQSLASARLSLSRNAQSLNAAIGAMLIGVTSFFRDAPVFDALRNIHLPALSARRKGLRVWSAACGDGCELYSIAMLLDSIGQLENAILFGSDCRPEAIMRARSGIYSAESISTVPADVRGRYFQRDWMNGSCRFSRNLVQRTQWRVENLLNFAPAPWDVILCRNVAMYLKPYAASELWAHLDAVLCRGGLLVLGKAERPVGIRRLKPVSPCIYRRES